MNKNKKMRKVYFSEVEWYPVWVIDNDVSPEDKIEISETDYKEIVDTFRKFKKIQNKIEKLVMEKYFYSRVVVGLNKATEAFKELSGIMNDEVKKLN